VVPRLRDRRHRGKHPLPPVTPRRPTALALNIRSVVVARSRFARGVAAPLRPRCASDGPAPMSGVLLWACMKTCDDRGSPPSSPNLAFPSQRHRILSRFLSPPNASFFSSLSLSLPPTILPLPPLPVVARLGSLDWACPSGRRPRCFSAAA
jgi:hypothetical protein